MTTKDHNSGCTNRINDLGIRFPAISIFNLRVRYSLATPSHSPSGLKAMSLTGRVHRVSNRTLSSLFRKLNRLTVQSSEAEANAFLDVATAVTGSVCCSKVSGSLLSSSTTNLRMS